MGIGRSDAAVAAVHGLDFLLLVKYKKCHLFCVKVCESEMCFVLL